MHKSVQTWLLAGLLTAIAPAARAQQQKQPPRAPAPSHWDVLYLKDGSIIRGAIISRQAGVLRMENRIKDTLVFAETAVDSIGLSPKPVKATRQGFYNINEAGIQFSGDKGLVLRCIAGYHFAWQWYTGIGIGLDDYTMRSVPIFADVRYELNRSRNQTPFAYAGAGVSIAWPSDMQLINGKQPDKKIPGLYVHAGLGHKIRLNQHNAIRIAAGYAMANMETRYAILDWATGEPLGTYTNYNYTYHRVTITAGFSF